MPAPWEPHSEILTSRRETWQAGHRLMALQRGGRSTGPFSGDKGTQRQRVVGAPWTRAACLSSLGIKAAWTLSEDPRRSCCKRVPSTEPVLLPWPGAGPPPSPALGVLSPGPALWTGLSLPLPPQRFICEMGTKRTVTSRT